MGKYIKIFNNHSEYEAFKASEDYITPNVSYCISENEVHYNPYVKPPFFCKLTLKDGSVIKLEGSGELTSAMTREYTSTVVSAEIGESCTSIGNYAFNGCSSLTNIVIQDGVTSIGKGAFSYCTDLSIINIPNSVTSIGDYVLLGCHSLTSIVCNATTAPTITDNTFDDVKSGGTLTIPTGSSGYDTWMQNANYYLGLYGWTKVEQ